jgi:hypothetical protein
MNSEGRHLQVLEELIALAAIEPGGIANEVIEL